MGANWTIEELQDYTERNPKAVTPEIKTLIQSAPKKSKYNNHKFEAEGIIWDSKKEYYRFKELQLLERSRQINGLSRQVRFVLQEKQPGIRAITYIADFVYLDIRTGQKIAEDTKGYKTQTYRIKKKMFIKKYPDYVFKES